MAQATDPHGLMDDGPALLAVLDKFSQGEQRHVAGDLKGALALYDEVLAVFPEIEAKAMMLANKGQVLTQLGDLEGALRCLDDAIRLNGTLESAWYNKGNALLAARRLQEALTCFGKAASVAEVDHADDPETLRRRKADALHNKGVCYQALGQESAAQTCFKQAREVRGEAGAGRALAIGVAVALAALGAAAALLLRH